MVQANYLLFWHHIGQLDVAGFSDPSFDRNMIDTLVMADERRKMIKALAENYAQKHNDSLASPHRPWTADFVEGKGEGKIFLLHVCLPSPWISIKLSSCRENRALGKHTQPVSLVLPARRTFGDLLQNVSLNSQNAP